MPQTPTLAFPEFPEAPVTLCHSFEIVKPSAINVLCIWFLMVLFWFFHFYKVEEENTQM